MIESTKPPGYDEWLARVQKVIESDPAAYEKFKSSKGSFVQQEPTVQQKATWDGMYTRKDAKREGTNTQSEAELKGSAVQQDVEKVDKEAAKGPDPTLFALEAEPALTADQYVDTERSIWSDAKQNTQNQRD